MISPCHASLLQSNQTQYDTGIDIPTQRYTVRPSGGIIRVAVGAALVCLVIMVAVSGVVFTPPASLMAISNPTTTSTAQGAIREQPPMSVPRAPKSRADSSPMLNNGLKGAAQTGLHKLGFGGGLESKAASSKDMRTPYIPYSRKAIKAAENASISYGISGGLVAILASAITASVIYLYRSMASSVGAGQRQSMFAIDGERRVVVTGMGLVTSLGQHVGDFYENLLKGKSGISLIEHFDTSTYSTKIAGEVKSVNTDGFVSAKDARRMDDCLKFTLVAGKEALADAGVKWDGPEIKDLDPERCGILVGSGMGGMDFFCKSNETLVTKGHKRMSPFSIPYAITNMGGALLGMDTGFMGPNYSISTACATGNYCIHNAAKHIQHGDADLMLAGGSDAACIPTGIGGFIACKALSKRNDDPEGASRPWDKNRDGFVLGEGAGVICLEELEHAKARGAHIYAEYTGGGLTCDAHHMTEPHPEGKGVINCINLALKDANLKPEDITYVNAHGTSTPAGDMAEYNAITTAIPHSDLHINSSKSMIGHLLGAAGAVEAIVSIKALETGMVHPNLNLIDPEEGVDTSKVVGTKAEKLDPKYTLSNSFGFGGHNSACIFGKYEE